MRAIVPVSLRKPEQRHTARAMADAILNADRRRQRRLVINNELGGSNTAPAPVKKRDGPFAALKHHPLYRASRHGAHRP
jgi:hypothetical protein